MNKILLLFFCFCCLFQCTTIATDPITDELMELTSTIEKKAYLEKVYNDIQGKTKNLPDNINEINEQKIGAYLALFGHPKIAEVGGIAAQTPWLVIHENDSEERIDIRTKYFPILFKAFLNRDISNAQMSMFLNRMYEYKVGEKYISKVPYGGKDEVYQLIRILNLETSRN